MSIMSQNLIPVHIAFIPIVIPPLLSLFNDLNMDRRLIGLVIGFGFMLAICITTIWIWSNIPPNYSKWVPKGAPSYRI